MSSVKETPVRSIAGRYTLLGSLGKGGVGQVWRARDELLRRDVAVKEVVFPAAISELDRASMQARVLREARAAAGLPHSSVVTVYDVIRDDTRGYIVMELIRARSISELVEREGPLPVPQVASIARQMVEVLEVAHDQGIIHRDVKPGNVMILEDGSVKLADFGIAWIKDDPKITASGLIMGSPSFMAPEQAQGAEITPATDMWGLGATIYYAVEGELAFDKGQTIATLTSVMVDPPRKPRRAGALAPLIHALLSKDPAARPTASQVKALLDPLLYEAQPASMGRPVVAPPVAAWESQSDSTVISDTPDAERGHDLSPGLYPAGGGAGEGALGGPAPPETGAVSAWLAQEGTNGSSGRPSYAVSDARGAVVGGVPEKIQAEMALGWDQEPRSDSTALRILGVLLALVLAAGAIFFLSRLTDGSPTVQQARREAAHQRQNQKKNAGNASNNSPSPAGPAAAPSASQPVAEASPSPKASAAAPSPGATTSGPSVNAIGATAGWIPYINTAVGWSLSYPPGWHPVQRDSHNIDFVDSAGGRYLRVAWTTTPGPNPAARWREYSKSFGARYPDYRTIDISTNFFFKGWKASAWEYTYSSGGSKLHAVDLALVNETYGFALNFQTHESDWLSSQPIFDAFKQSFKPPT